MSPKSQSVAAVQAVPSDPTYDRDAVCTITVRRFYFIEKTLDKVTKTVLRDRSTLDVNTATRQLNLADDRQFGAYAFDRWEDTDKGLATNTYGWKSGGKRRTLESVVTEQIAKRVVAALVKHANVNLTTARTMVSKVNIASCYKEVVVAFCKAKDINDADRQVAAFDKNWKALQASAKTAAETIWAAEAIDVDLDID